MTSDWFVASIVSANVPEEARENVLGLVREHALEFLRANGSVPFDRWQTLGPESRKAFADAGDALRREQAAMTALYSFDPIEAVRVLKGDEAATRMALEVQKPVTP